MSIDRRLAFRRKHRIAPGLGLALLVALVAGAVLPALAVQNSGSAKSGNGNAGTQQTTKAYIPAVMSYYRYFTPEQLRFGVNEVRNTIDSYEVYDLNAAWYVTSPQLNPPVPAGMQPVFVVHLKGIDPDLITQMLAPYLARNRGRLWLIGNEPDREAYQDDLLPGEYVVYYHNIYYFLKAEDPTAQVAIGAVVQPTPLRLYYLDMILDAYQSRYGQAMPVDVWNIHNMILNEHPDEWGAGIPPGVPDDIAEALRVEREVLDNDNLDIFREQAIAFRQWMADRGQRNKPLIITEFGVLMPYLPEYPDQFPFTEERVRAFMYGAFDFLLSATDDSTGHPDDGNRLVQKWAWYSLDDKFDPDTWQGFNGNLFLPDTLEISGHGVHYGSYTAGLR
jgi:hypothetical protein